MRSIAILATAMMCSVSAATADTKWISFDSTTIGNATFSGLSLPVTTGTSEGKPTITFNGYKCLVTLPAGHSAKLTTILELFDASDPNRPFAFITQGDIQVTGGAQTVCGGGNGDQTFAGRAISSARLQVTRIESIDSTKLKKLKTH